MFMFLLQFSVVCSPACLPVSLFVGLFVCPCACLYDVQSWFIHRQKADEQKTNEDTDRPSPGIPVPPCKAESHSPYESRRSQKINNSEQKCLFNFNPIRNRRAIKKQQE